jgi:trans-aconitate methyltransferase
VEEMKTSEAVQLIGTPLIDWGRPQLWCDLGCGTGTFTLALAQLLAPGSTIHAVDQDRRALSEIPDRLDGVEICKTIGDLRKAGLSLPAVDGILMANALHFIRKQRDLLKRLLSVTDCFLIVEYERSVPNPWNPYPVPFSEFRKLCSETGLERVEKISTKRSRFGGTMYSALAKASRA